MKQSTRASKLENFFNGYQTKEELTPTTEELSSNGYLMKKRLQNP